jgi:undecaprenyl-diphosphatase
VIVNEQLLDAINGAAGRSPLLDALGRMAASDVIYLLGVALLLLGAWEWRRDRRRAVRIALAGVGAAAIALAGTMALGQLWYESRPFVGDADTIKLISHAADASFPSDHAAVAAAAATVGMLAWPRVRLFLALAVAAIALGRVFVGVHYPGDVLAGVALGATAGIAAWWTVSRMAGARTAEGNPGGRVGSAG